MTQPPSPSSGGCSFRERFEDFTWKLHCRRKLTQQALQARLLSGLGESLLRSQLSTAQTPALRKLRKQLEQAQSASAGRRFMGFIAGLPGAMERTLCALLGKPRVQRLKLRVLLFSLKCGSSYLRTCNRGLRRKH